MFRFHYLSRQSEASEALVACQKVEMTFFVPYSSPHGWAFQGLTYARGSGMTEKASWTIIIVRVGINHDSGLLTHYCGIGLGFSPDMSGMD